MSLRDSRIASALRALADAIESGDEAESPAPPKRAARRPVIVPPTGPVSDTAAERARQALARAGYDVTKKKAS